MDRGQGDYRSKVGCVTDLGPSVVRGLLLSLFSVQATDLSHGPAPHVQERIRTCQFESSCHQAILQNP
jgi:hypothetical protein